MTRPINHILYKSQISATRALKFFSVIFFTLMVTAAFSQQEVPELDEYGVPIEYEEDEVFSDSLSVKGPKKNTLKTLFRGNPGRAALYSLVLPGAGQVYNRKWWKLPIVYAIEGAAIYNVYYSYKQFDYYDDIFKILSSGGVHKDFTSASQVKSIRDKYRKQKEYSWVYAAIAHLVTVFDAYVDRHLIEFDIEEDLNAFKLPNIPSQPYVGITFKYKIN